MKKIVLILVLAFAGISYLSEITSRNPVLKKEISSNATVNTSNKSEVVERSSYKFKVELDGEASVVDISERITWINKGGSETEKLKFYFYPNGYGEIYSSSEEKEITEEHLPKITFQKFDIIYEDFNILNKLNYNRDSTIITAQLKTSVSNEDSLTIEIFYRLEIPKTINGLGHSMDREFYSFINWYPKLGVYHNGQWNCQPGRNYQKTFSMPADYALSVIAPEKFEIISNAKQEKRNNLGGSYEYLFKASGYNDIAWFAASEILSEEKEVRGIPVKVYVQPERERYLKRYFETIENSIEYLETNIAEFPFEQLVLLDTPKASDVAGRVFPGLFTTRSNLISPAEIHELEYPIVYSIARQYFGNAVINNSISETWLSEGLPAYLAEEIVYHYYGPGVINFKIANYYPIYGLNFLSYNEIPIIYTLGIFEYPKGSRFLKKYYNEMNIGRIADSSQNYPSGAAYIVNNIDKPALMFQSLERIICRENLMAILSKFYSNRKFKLTSQGLLISELNKSTNKNLDWFFDNVYSNPIRLDYRIKKVNKRRSNTYEVFAEKVGEGFFKTELALYTENDTLKQIWDTEKNWKKFVFKTEEKVIAAEIDPKRQNIFDLNYANNSYTIDSKHWAAWSLSIRWLFWVQNALMILGSIG